MLYLDNAATTKIDDSVFEAMLPYLKDSYGNPSSMHKKGIEAKKAINDARKSIAKHLNCSHDSLVFTQSGTMAINLAIKGLSMMNQDKTEIITTKIDHKATISTCKYLETQGFKVTYLDVNREGYIDLEDLRKAITTKTLLVSIIWANNEIGVIQNVSEILKVTKEEGVYLHLDAVQMLPHYPIDLETLPVDLMSFSAHKLFGPKGIGLLYHRPGMALSPMIHGAKQEFGLNAGTENVSGIIGFSKAVENAYTYYHKKQEALKEKTDLLEKKLLETFPCYINGPKSNRLPGLLSVSFKDQKGHELAYELSKKGIYVSTGSACNESSIELSHVIKAITDDTPGVIRFSLAYDLTNEDIDYIIQSLKDLLE